MVDKDKAIVKESGRIAGSTLRLCDALRNMCAYCGCQKEAAIAMASAHPAALYGWKKGRLEVGYDADIMIMDEQLPNSSSASPRNSDPIIVCFSKCFNIN